MAPLPSDRLAAWVLTGVTLAGCNGANSGDSSATASASAGETSTSGPGATSTSGATDTDTDTDTDTGGEALCDPLAPSPGPYAAATERPGFVIDGDTPCDPPRLRALADVDGDGREDLIVETSSGRVYVIFGRTKGGVVDLAAVAAGEGGFVIDPGAEPLVDWRAFGDVNGDGRVDLVGATESGHTFVILGSPQTAPRSLDALGADQGFVLEHGGAWSAAAFEALADVNGDGLDDLVFGRLDPGRPGVDWALAVVLGDPALAGASLDDLLDQDHGYVVTSTDSHAAEGVAVVGLGDIDGDGFEDLSVVTWTTSQYEGGWDAIEVARGKAQPVDLDAVLAAGDLYDASAYGDADINGDGFKDIVVAGSHGPLQGGVCLRNAVEVYLGGPAPGTEWSYDGALLQICGSSVDDDVHLDLRGIGDVNGDGRDDLILQERGEGTTSTHVVFGRGAELGFVDVVDLEGGLAPPIGATLPVADAAALDDLSGDGIHELAFVDRAGGVEPASGRVYVVHGHPEWSTELDLAALEAGDGGFAVDGERSGDRFGEQIDAGDINGDGLADLVVNAPGAGPKGPESGRIYVFFGAG
ncbi:MAG: VCBS repeat-containing protein [Myxococcales bacterium]|nr:VCBS repeat-containing protein [Myxococcales bacterium]